MKMDPPRSKAGSVSEVSCCGFRQVSRRTSVGVLVEECIRLSGQQTPGWGDCSHGQSWPHRQLSPQTWL